jgi:type IV pilus assembly protein PilW
MSSRRRHGQAGLSLVELMIGIAVGLFIVAAATFMLTYQLRDTRRLLLESQLEQELRAAADLMAREIRRANYTPDAVTQLASVNNGNNSFVPTFTVPTSGDAISFAYSQSGAATPLPADYSGFRLQGDVLQVQLGNGSWQPLTDDQVVTIVKFKVTPPRAVSSVPTPYCPPPGATCPPALNHRVQTVDITLRGQSVHDASVQRELQTHVRLRNDAL